jgi:hypothetical protein
MTEAKAHVAENQISKQDPTVVALHQSTQCYFCPESEELIFIADSDAGEFENHWREMMTRVDEFHLAQEAYSAALETYGITVSTTTLASRESEAYMAKVVAAEDKLEEERKALQDKLGTFSQKGMSYDEVVELLPIAGQRKKRKPGSKPVRYAYVKKGYFSDSKAGKKLHTVSLKGSDKDGAKNSIYSKDKHGNRSIDIQRLKKQLSSLKGPKLNLDLKDIVDWTGLDFDPEALNEDFALFEWAEAWNRSLLGKTELGASVDLSAGAQFMRFVSNVGASAEFDPSKGNVAVKGEAKATLTVASGMVNMTVYVPDRLGWSLSYASPRGNTFDMGMLRLYLTPELNGFIGASVQVEGQLQVVTQGNQQLLAGQPGGRLPRFKERRTKGAVFHKQMAAEDESVKLSSEAFAGARVEGSLKGGLQWLKPAPPLDPNTKVAGLLKSSGEFTEFCSIAGNAAGMLGAGAGAKFQCTFINGKFCFHVAASLCWGAGAKGGLICEVNTKTIVEFGAWLVYQLYRLDYGFFEVVEEDAFKAYSAYCVMQMSATESDIYEVYGFLKTNASNVLDRFKDYLETVLDEGKNNLSASKERNSLARQVNSNFSRLLRYTPEAKGILLYLLTRHGIWDHVDLDNRGSGWIPDLYQDRKKAVIWVLKSIQTRAEWRKVLCRMSADGVSLAREVNELDVMKQREEHLVNFLKEGIDMDEQFYKAKSELAVIYGRLKESVAWGYALSMNDSEYYSVNRLPNVHYPRRCIFEPCAEGSGRWA